MAGRVNIERKDVMDKRRVCCFCEKWESGGIESFLHSVIVKVYLRQNLRKKVLGFMSCPAVSGSCGKTIRCSGSC